MRDDFTIFVLSHGRPDNVPTVRRVRAAGYTGAIHIVVDDEDPTLDEYRERFDNVLVFNKAEVAEQFDEGDLAPDRRTVVYARNACWQLANQLGIRWFAQFDDDYSTFSFRWMGRKNGEKIPRRHGWTIRQSMDDILEAMIQFHESTPTTTIAMAQGGDVIGGAKGAMARIRFKRKAMNSFICDTQQPFMFLGRINEDVNTYVVEGSRGKLFLTFSPLQLEQHPTQGNDGGMTDVYLASGTYLKSFFTVMMHPSSVKVRQMGPTNPRLHHRIRWDHTVPKIIHESHRVE